MIPREDYILACLSCSNGKEFTSVQVQKLFFILDKNLKDRLFDNYYYDFQPYHYGPFDKNVYSDLENLSNQGLVDIIYKNNYRIYKLTIEGHQKGHLFYLEFPEKVQNYIKKIVDFVLSLSFSELVTSIYKAYPEMKINSIFQGV